MSEKVVALIALTLLVSFSTPAETIAGASKSDVNSEPIQPTLYPKKVVVEVGTSTWNQYAWSKYLSLLK